MTAVTWPNHRPILGPISRPEFEQIAGLHRLITGFQSLYTSLVSPGGFLLVYQPFIQTHFGGPVNLPVISLLGSMGSDVPVNLVQILILSSVGRVVISKERTINTREPLALKNSRQ